MFLRIGSLHINPKLITHIDLCYAEYDDANAVAINVCVPIGHMGMVGNGEGAIETCRFVYKHNQAEALRPALVAWLEGHEKRVVVDLPEYKHPTWGDGDEPDFDTAFVRDLNDDDPF